MNFFDFGEVIDTDTEFVIFGIPWDYLTSIEAPNSALAPSEIRKVSNDLALTTELGYKIPDLNVVDLGDIKIENEEDIENLYNGGDGRSDDYVMCDVLFVYD